MRKLRLTLMICLTLFVMLLTSDERFRVRPKPAHQFARPHVTEYPQWLSVGVLSAFAQLVDCDCTESKPKEKCPSLLFGPWTSYECKFTGNTTKRCQQLDPWPPSDPNCAGCLRATNVSCNSL